MIPLHQEHKKTYTVTTTDVFGNKVTGVALTATVSNGTLDTVTATTGSGLTNFGTADFKVTMAASGNAVAIFGLGSSVTAQSAIAGFATPVLTASKVVANRDLATELASMTAARDAANAALTAEKAASAKALADAKALSDAELLKANAEIAKLKAEAVTAKVASDKALADAQAAAKTELDAVKAENAKALAALKKSFNALIVKWNKANPKAKVALVK